MISWLRGEIVEKNGISVVLSVRGVGYEILVGDSLVNAVSIEQEVTFYTHMVVKQDGFELFGFESALVRNIFRKLMSVSGVGGKNALSLVSTLGGTGVLQSIQTGDAKALSRAPGIGTRVSTRIINDLEGKLDDLPIGEGLPDSEDMMTKQSAAQALVALGFTIREAHETVGGAWVKGMNLEILIRRSLQRLNLKSGN